MNALTALLHHPLTHRIGWVLLHSLWQGALVGLIFALARLSLRRASANARYLAGCAALTLIVAPAVVTLLILPSPSAIHDAAVSATVPVRLEPPRFPNHVAQTLPLSFGSGSVVDIV